MTALEKEKLIQEVNQLKNQDFWSWANVSTPFSILAAVAGALFALFRWFADRRAERERRAEEHFQAIATDLGSTNLATQAGAAILLRTFLRPGYEQFYRQVFDLAVTHLRLRPINPNTAEPVNSLDLALITLLRESFPLARDYLKQSPRVLDATSIQLDRYRGAAVEPAWWARVLDATSIQLDSVLLSEADLQDIWMPEAHLREANIRNINLRGALLRDTDFFDASLHGANLSEAHIFNASFRKARLNWANLHGTNLRGTSFTEADLTEADLSGADLTEANLSGAKVTPEQLGKAKSLEGITMPDGSTPHGMYIDPSA